MLLFRKYHIIDKQKMKTYLLSTEILINPSKEADILLGQYHSTLSTLDKHAPPHTKHAKAKYIAGLVNESLIVAKRPSICSKSSSAETNLPSIDPNTCRKSTSATESTCRPNLNSVKQQSHQRHK